MSPAPVSTKNCFEALADRCVLDSDGVQIYRDGIVDLNLLLKPTKPNKKRRGNNGTFVYGFVEFCKFGGDIFRAQSNREVSID